MRDLVTLLAVLAWVPMAVMSGFAAFLLWIATSLLSPQLYLYGFMIEFRYALVFAFIALMALVLGRVKDRGSFIADKVGVLLTIFVLHGLISSLFNWSSNPFVLDRLVVFLKGMMLALMAPYFITSRARIHLTLFVVIASLGFHGFLDGAKVLASGGGHIVKGIPGGALGDNNLMAVGMVMLLPLILYLYKCSSNRLAKLGLLCVFFLCLMTVLGSNSRGGFLALSILGFWYWITSSRKTVAAIFLVIISVLVVQLAPDRWFDRISTIKEANVDESFLSRLAAWKISLNIANDNPVFGGGFYSSQVPWMWDKYKNVPNFINVDIPDRVAYKAAHSIYFQVLGDLGYLGLIIFLVLLVAAFVTHWQIHQIVNRFRIDASWASNLSTSIVLSLVAFMAGGGGVSVGYFELAYLLIVMLSIIRGILLNSCRVKDDGLQNGPSLLGTRHV